MRRRDLLAASAALAGASLARPGQAATPGKTIRFVPQADLSSIDPIWTTATEKTWSAPEKDARS